MTYKQIYLPLSDLGYILMEGSGCKWKSSWYSDCVYLLYLCYLYLVRFLLISNRMFLWYLQNRNICSCFASTLPGLAKNTVLPLWCLQRSLSYGESGCSRLLPLTCVQQSTIPSRSRKAKIFFFLPLLLTISSLIITFTHIEDYIHGASNSVNKRGY